MLLKLQGRSFHIPFGRNWIHVFIAGMLNVVAFGLFGTFAQLSTATTRVIIINYSMPIWASMLAWMILRERPNAWVGAGLALCIAGLSVLVYPVAATSLQEPTGLILAFLCALSWAAGTIYMKAIRIEGDLLAVTMWQIVVGVVVFGVGYLIVQGPPAFEPLQLRTWLGVFYSGFFGTAFAYFIWYNIIGKVSTATASLGTLANPVVGVIGSVILLGERLTDRRHRRFRPHLRRGGLRAAAAAEAGRRPRVRQSTWHPNQDPTTPRAPSFFSSRWRSRGAQTGRRSRSASKSSRHGATA